MRQNYTTFSPGLERPVTLKGNKGILIILVLISLTSAAFTAYITGAVTWTNITDIAFPGPENQRIANDVHFGKYYGTDSVATLVEKALYFRSLLTALQISTLEQAYTPTLARKWSNLPCGAGCRNGIQLGTLTATQLAAALDVIKAAAGTTANEGYDEFTQIRYADTYLRNNGGGTGYDSTIFFLSFLNTPTTTGAWMIQYGGHHYAANIAYNAGKVVGTTPMFEALEPRSFALNNVTYAPLKQERDSLAMMLASLTSTQLATARLSTTFSDCLLSPGESNGNTNMFPATKQGLKVSDLTTAQKDLTLAAIRNYTRDVDDSAGAVLQAVYASEIDSTYIAFTGNGISGDTSTFLNATNNYVRIDGPSVWIELTCPSGIVFRNQIHYHSVYRDHLRDYGRDLTNTGLPLNLLSFDAVIQGKGQLLHWTTEDEIGVNYFEVQRSVGPTAVFAAIGKVPAKKATRNTYTYNDDESLNEDVIYYRLKMVELDGKSRFSNVAAVKYNSVVKGTSIYPNPASNLLTISNSQNVQNATIRIINNVGKTVMSSDNRTGRKINVDISKLAPGSYFVQLLTNGNTSTLKFVKQR